MYTARERVALAWTEAVTAVTDGHVDDQAYREVREQFSEAEVAALIQRRSRSRNGLAGLAAAPGIGAARRPVGSGRHHAHLKHGPCRRRDPGQGAGGRHGI